MLKKIEVGGLKMSVTLIATSNKPPRHLILEKKTEETVIQISLALTDYE